MEFDHDLRELARDSHTGILVSDGGPVTVLDLSQPLAPKVVATIKSLTSASSVDLGERYAYVGMPAKGRGGSTLFVLDLKHPSRPGFTRQVPISETLQGVSVRGNNGLALLERWIEPDLRWGTLPRFLIGLDLTDPAAPKPLLGTGLADADGLRELEHGRHFVYGTDYSATDSGGGTTIDVIDPKANPPRMVHKAFDRTETLRSLC